MAAARTGPRGGRGWGVPLRPPRSLDHGCLATRPLELHSGSSIGEEFGMAWCQNPETAPSRPARPFWLHGFQVCPLTCSRRLGQGLTRHLLMSLLSICSWALGEEKEPLTVWGGRWIRGAQRNGGGLSSAEKGSWGGAGVPLRPASRGGDGGRLSVQPVDQARQSCLWGLRPRLLKRCLMPRWNGIRPLC